MVLIGASGGAGLTKVQLASRKTEAVPSPPRPANASLLSRLPELYRNPAVLAGIGLFGVLLLVLLLFFAPSLTDSWRAASQAPITPAPVSDKSGEQKVANNPPAQPPPNNASSERPVEPPKNVVPPVTAAPAGNPAPNVAAVPNGAAANPPVPGLPANQEAAKPGKVDWNILKGSYLTD